MKRIDLRKDLRHLYVPPSKKIVVIDVPSFQFLMIDGAIESGEGPSTSPRFQEDMQALYGAAYTLKFMLKLRKKNPVDYPVMALEGLWWVTDGVFDIRQPGNWKYTVMILQPDLITTELLKEALAQLRKKRGDQPAFARLRLKKFHEGLCVQAMHLGPYADEPATVEKMQAFLRENGYRDRVARGGKHHEIYMSDPRRTEPSRLKTILRHPIAGAR
jgi:hypothetical protein